MSKKLEIFKMHETTFRGTCPMKSRPKIGAGLLAAARMYSRFFLAAATCYGLLGGVAAAKEPLFNRPVYEPVTGNFFELRKATLGYSLRGAEAIGWASARILARRSVYKGRKGRLAVVKTREVNDFLRRTFKPNRGAWIGLRYWCDFNKLQWVTGEFQDRTAYANWAPIWNRAGSPGAKLRAPTCGQKNRYWPVHYRPVENGFLWNANGTKKEMRAFFIEYPTGEQ